METVRNFARRIPSSTPSLYPNPKTLKRHGKSNKIVKVLLQSGKDLRSIFSSKQLFCLCQDSTVDVEIEGRGMFKYPRLKRFFRIYKKYIKDLKIRIAGEVFISDQNVKQFLSCFKHIFSLRGLDLEFSSFESALTDKGLKAILHQLRVYSKLQAFSILCNGANNCVKDESMAQFSRIIKRKKNLEKIELNLRGADNFITDRGMELFYKELSVPILSLKSLRLDLKSFGLNNNKLTNNGAYYLSLALQKLVALEILYLDFSGGTNGIGDDGLAKIAESLMSMKNLKNFTLDCQMGLNEISSRGARVLAECLNQLNFLNTVHLNFSNYSTLYGGNNGIGDSGFNNIFSLINNKPSFQEFVLKASRNNISDYGIKELAKSTFSPKCAKKLECDLRGNDNITKDSQVLFQSTVMELATNFTIFV